MLRTLATFWKNVLLSKAYSIEICKLIHRTMRFISIGLKAGVKNGTVSRHEVLPHTHTFFNDVADRYRNSTGAREEPNSSERDGAYRLEAERAAMEANRKPVHCLNRTLPSIR
jgi:hypothetical protein